MAKMHLRLGTTVYLVRVTEYERGWGSRPEGFLVFETIEDRAKFIQDMNAEKQDVVPDYYWDYSIVSHPHQLTKVENLHSFIGTSVLTTWLST